jgi:putative inorganic carbon (HCO3(-)) transporter
VRFNAISDTAIQCQNQGLLMIIKNKNFRHPIWLDIIEGGGVLVALPFLMFPTVKPVLTTICMVGLCLIWILTTMIRNSPWPQTPFNGVMLLLFFMVAVGTGITAFPDLTLSKAAGLILGFALWRFLSYAITDHRRLRWAIAGFLILCAGMTLVGILATDWPREVRILNKLFSLLPERLLDLPESVSTEHTNQLGGAILIYYPWALSAVIYTWHKRKKWYVIAAFSMVTLAILLLLILTQSRSTWIGMLVSTFCLLLLWAFLTKSSRHRKVLMVLAGFMVLSGVVGVLIIGPDRLSALMQEPRGMTAFGTLDTLAFRQEVWRWAVVAISDFPFTGCGLGTFRRVVTLLYPLNVQLSDIAHAHNIFLQTALDVGIPGLIAYIALVGLMLWEAWRAVHNQVYRVVAAGIFGGILGLHVYGLLDALTLGSKPAIAFWYSLGLLSALARLPNVDEGALVDSRVTQKD